MTGGRSWTRRPPCLSSWRGRPAPVRPPPRLAPAAFVSPALSSPQPLRPLPASVAAGNQAAQRAGRSASPKLRPPGAPAALPRIRRVPGRAARPGPSWSCRVAAACSVSSPPPQFHADPHLRPKNLFRTRILFRIKTLFFCFLSVSSKECRTLKTNLVFFSFTGFLQFRRMLQT